MKSFNNKHLSNARQSVCVSISDDFVPQFKCPNNYFYNWDVEWWSTTELGRLSCNSGR